MSDTSTYHHPSWPPNCEPPRHDCRPPDRDDCRPHPEHPIWPPQPPCPPPPPDHDQCARTIEALTRTIQSQNRTIARLQSGSSSCGPCPPPDQCDPCEPIELLWGGPYPLHVGNTPPTQTKVWFDTGANQLKVWNWQTIAWEQVLPTVYVNPIPPTGAQAPIGQLYIDGANKLWVKVDDWKELTFPVLNSPVPETSAPFVASLGPPQTPLVGSLWYQPSNQDLFMWSGLTWVRIGTRVVRNVRVGSYANSWNAGGNRAQAESAGNFLYIAGIRGIDPVTQLQQPGPGPLNAQGTTPPNTQPNGNLRINQIYTNIKTICQAEGISLFECMGLDTYIASNAYINPTASLQAQGEFWGNGPYPNRTHITMLQMSGSDTEAEYGATVPGWPARGDIVEVTSVFWLGGPGPGIKRVPNSLASEVLAMPGVTMGTGFPPMSMAQPSPQPGQPDNGNGNGDDEAPRPQARRRRN